MDAALNLESIPAVGRCIYCLRDDVPLADEHIIPFGLSGTWVLRKASCQSCARITSAFERIVLREDLQRLRAAGQFKTRRRNERPTHLPLTISTSAGEKTLHLPTQNGV